MQEPAPSQSNITETQWLEWFDAQEKNHRKSVDDRRLTQYADMDRFSTECKLDQPHDLVYSLQRLKDFYGDRLPLFYELMSNIQLTAENEQVTSNAIQKWLERLRKYCCEWNITPEMFNRMMLYATKE